MSQSVFYWILDISLYSILLPTLILLLRWRSLRGSIRILAYFILFKLGVEVIATTLARLGIHNWFLFHYYIPLEFIFVSWLYAEAMQGFVARRWFWYIAGIFTGYSLINSLFIQPYPMFNSYARTVESIGIMGYALGYFYKLLSDLKVEKLEKDPFFLVSISLLLFFAGSLFAYLLRNLKMDESVARLIQSVPPIFNFLGHIFFALALWLDSLQDNLKDVSREKKN